MAMGVWFVLLSWVAPFFGGPTHLLVFALGGGGMFLAGAIYVGVWTSGRRQAAAFAGVWPTGEGASR